MEAHLGTRLSAIAAHRAVAEAAAAFTGRTAISDELQRAAAARRAEFFAAVLERDGAAWLPGAPGTEIGQRASELIGRHAAAWEAPAAEACPGPLVVSVVDVASFRVVYVSQSVQEARWRHPGNPTSYPPHPTSAHPTDASATISLARISVRPSRQRV